MYRLTFFCDNECKLWAGFKLSVGSELETYTYGMLWKPLTNLTDNAFTIKQRGLFRQAVVNCIFVYFYLFIPKINGNIFYRNDTVGL